MPTWETLIVDGVGNDITASTSWTDSTWISWVDQNTTAATQNTFRIWKVWTTNYATTGGTVLANAPFIAAVARGADRARYVRRAEDDARYEARLVEELAQREVRAKTQRAAIERSLHLLRTMLDAEQRQQFDVLAYFDVIARGSQKRYRIHTGTHGNVRLLDGDREVVRYCAQPDGVPTADAMLAQKLQIEHDEAGFLSVANATRCA